MHSIYTTIILYHLRNIDITLLRLSSCSNKSSSRTNCKPWQFAESAALVGLALLESQAQRTLGPRKKVCAALALGFSFKTAHRLDLFTSTVRPIFSQLTYIPFHTSRWLSLLAADPGAAPGADLAAATEVAEVAVVVCANHSQQLQMVRF